MTTGPRVPRPRVPGTDLPAPGVGRRLEPLAEAAPGWTDGSALTSATLSAVDLTGSHLPEVLDVQLDASVLDRVRAAGGSWRELTLADCRIRGADLAGLATHDLTMMRCDVADTRLTGAGLTGARLRSVRLTGVRADLTTWQGATLEHVVLTGCDLTEADLGGVVLSDALLEDCDLTGARLSGARCSGVRLQGCRLDAVTGVTGLRGADVAEEDAYRLLPAMARELGITISG